jgi:hypothetical protein
MTDGIGQRYDFTAHHRHSSGSALVRTAVASVALAGTALACGWFLCVNVDGARVQTVPVVQTTAAPDASDTTDAIDPFLYAGLFDAKLGSGSRPMPLSQSEPLDSEFRPFARVSAQADIAVTRDSVPPPGVRQLVRSVPVPPARPAEFGVPQTRNPALALARRNAVVPPAEPTLFDRLFRRPQNAGTQLAYAGPDGGVFGDGQSMTSGNLSSDKLTAVYDISARKVYMPDGTTLEAHSGLGSRLDDPDHVHERMRGATPPHVYDLTLRESLFHGVRALRLTPVDGANPYGRTGLLAHTYMLGPNGDSNGCVSFKNYNAFLQAYLNHKVERLVVVARRD